jgi:hypothetical protein
MHLQLSDWGFIAQDGGLYLLPSLSSQSQQYAIYSPIPHNVEIDFLIQIDSFHTSSDHQANIRFGIVPTNPPVPDEGTFLAYHYLPNYPDRVFPKLLEEGKYSEPYSTLIIGDAQKVVILIQGNFLSVSVDENTIIDKHVLRFEDRLFWIDFYLPAFSEMSVFISGLSVLEY